VSFHFAVSPIYKNSESLNSIHIIGRGRSGVIGQFWIGPHFCPCCIANNSTSSSQLAAWKAGVYKLRCVSQTEEEMGLMTASQSLPHLSKAKCSHPCCHVRIKWASEHVAASSQPLQETSGVAFSLSAWGESHYFKKTAFCLTYISWRELRNNLIVSLLHWAYITRWFHESQQTETLKYWQWPPII
jgi:hypothetical protein